jgi:putative peptide zinc metalloprotease protein
VLYELVLPDGSRVPLTGETLTIGRARASDLRLDDPSVSRVHARVRVGPGGPAIEDAGSRSGTWLDGRRLRQPEKLHDGAQIRLGDESLHVERQRSEAEPGRTIVVPEGASAALPAVAAQETATTRFGARPRLRSGYALKRLAAAEGPRRWVLKDLVSGKFVRMPDDDARLLRLLDGRRSLGELVRDAERELGPAGAPALARLLADLGERGLLSGQGRPAEPRARRGLGRMFAARTFRWHGAGDLFGRLYADGGRLLFTPPAVVLLALVALGGVLAFAYLIVGRYGTPFVVASRVGLGGLVFLLGRLAIAAVHETAHGLTMASFGRRVGAAGLKLVLVFPYAFVDTSDVWFESRRRRMAVSAAGPVSDFTLGGLFSLAALVLPLGTTRDIFFQLALAAYVGGLFNINPFLERDGYHILVDLLNEPTLRRRAREDLRARLSGRARGAPSRVLARYSLFGLAWSTVATLFTIGLSLRYEPRLAALLPGPLPWVALMIVWLALFAPVLLTVGAPLVARRRLNT